MLLSHCLTWVVKISTATKMHSLVTFRKGEFKKVEGKSFLWAWSSSHQENNALWKQYLSQNFPFEKSHLCRFPPYFLVLFTRPHYIILVLKTFFIGIYSSLNNLTCVPCVSIPGHSMSTPLELRLHSELNVKYLTWL